MKIRKKPTIISVLSLVLCLSLVIGIAYRMPLTAHAVEVTATMSGMTSAGGGVSQPADNVYTFNPGAQIQIVGWTGNWDEYNRPWNDPTDTWWNSTVSTYNGTKWMTEPYMRWQNGEGLQHNFLSYWPANLADPNSDLRNVPIEIKGDSAKDDILFARWNGIRPDDNTLHLQFNHLMARFDVHLLFNDEYANVTDISIENKLRSKASVDLLMGEVTAMAGRGSRMEKSQHPDDNYHWSGTCIAVPQVFTGELLTLEFTADGKEYSLTYEHTTPLAFKSDERTTLYLAVGKDKVELMDVTVSDWADGGNITGGEAEECMHVTYENNTCTVCGKKKEDGQ